ncbi:hypothetical protein E1A91_D10G288800v1 [Gossypium mustelinum]|uniref:TIR domain-containing protein n=1 Tax=Gossypium mustelinum TaxID=34275 RepID=A0A5D2TF85_GOSMU|nr:hypothetical protein E1A91_D10G288800v1 [Gossypium mustelinum]
MVNVFFHDEKPEQLSQPLSPEIASSSRLKHQVFLSFRGEDTRPNFTAHLLKALKDTGMNVFFDEEKLEKGEQLSQALSLAIAASNLSIIVLSVDYASSKSCLAELSDIMRRKDTQGHIALPIFTIFKTSFNHHESNRLPQVQRWKTAFAEVGKLKGWHIEGGKFDRPETEYIKDIVEYVIKKLMSGKLKSASAELVGIDDQKQTILTLIEQEDSRLIGLWGQDSCFLLNVREKLKKQGIESLRNELLPKLLNQAIHVDTPSIGSTLIQERLSNKRVLVVLDDVNDSDQIDCFGVKHFGDGSKIIVTSRDRQVLKNGGVDKIHKVKKLKDNDSLQLFSTFAFKQLNPAVEFQDLSKKFVEYAQGKYERPKISQILRSSFDDLDELEKNIFLDIAIFFKGTLRKDVEKILSCCYKGVVSGISNLIHKCLLDSTPYIEWIFMHDMLEEMGKDIVRKESINPEKRSRLWGAKDVFQVLRYNKGINRIEGMKLDISQIDNLRLHRSAFKGMINLKVIFFYTDDQVDSVSLPKELKYLRWDYYPFKSLSGFNPKNLVVLKLIRGDIEYLWNDDDHQNLRKIPSLLGAINLEILECSGCESLVELPWLNHLTSLNKLGLTGCCNLKTFPVMESLRDLNLSHCPIVKFPEIPRTLIKLNLSGTQIEEVSLSLDSLGNLQTLDMSGSRVKNVSIKMEAALRDLNLSHCPMTEFPEIPRSLRKLNLFGTQIKEVTLSLDSLNNLQMLKMSCSSIQKLQCSIIPFGLKEIPIVDVSSPILMSKSIYRLQMDHCESLTVGSVTEITDSASVLCNKPRCLLRNQMNSSKRKKKKLRKMERKINEQTDFIH